VDLYSRKLVADHQITGPQLVCLNSIVELGPITATDLSYQVHLSASTVVRILDRLESKGLIQRQRQEDDRRRVHVTATISGHELSAKAPYSDRHPLRNALKQLPVEEQEIVTNLLEQLVGLMDAHGLSASPVLEVGSIQKAVQATKTLTEDEIEQEEALDSEESK
jgi:DNA-binding MarR family transcriptional regulator